MPDLLTWNQPDDTFRGQPDGYRIWTVRDHTGWHEVTATVVIEPCLDCRQMEPLPEWEGGYIRMQAVWDSGGTSPVSPAIKVPEPLPEVGLLVGLLGLIILGGKRVKWTRNSFRSRDQRSHGSAVGSSTRSG